MVSTNHQSCFFLRFIQLSKIVKITFLLFFAQTLSIFNMSKFNYLQKFIFIFILAVLAMSCSNENPNKLIQNSNITSIKNNYSQNENAVSKASAIEHLERKYDIRITENKEGNYTVYYSDDRYLHVRKTGELTANITGTKIGGRSENITGNIEIINEIPYITNIEGFLPCSQHPGGESYGDCFDREWEDMWDDCGLCLVSYTPYALLVAIVIGAHCAVC